MIFILSQVVTLSGYLVFWISRFLKSKKNIILATYISTLLSMTSFVLLQTFDGVAYNLFILLGRNPVGLKMIDKEQKVKQKAFSILWFILIIIEVLTYKGVQTIFLTIVGSINTYAYVVSKPQELRILGTIVSITYLVYQSLIPNVTGIVCESICAAVSIISYIKYKTHKEDLTL